MYVLSVNSSSNTCSTLSVYDLLYIYTYAILYVQWLADEFIPYLKEWEGSVEKRSGFSPQSKTMMVIAKETRNGINITGK